MKANTESNSGAQLSPETLKFFGEITASVTHELSNVLSTIEQVVGLIEDLAITREAMESGVSEKMNSVVDRVTRQLERGTALIGRLNGFAHLNDAFIQDCNVGELLENITALSERFARLRKVGLSTEGFDRSLTIRSNPILLAQAIYSAIRRTLLVADPAVPLEIRFTPRGGAAEIVFEAGCSEVDAGGETDYLRILITQLGGRLQEEREAERYRLTMTVASQG